MCYETIMQMFSMQMKHGFNDVIIQTLFTAKTFLPHDGWFLVDTEEASNHLLSFLINDIGNKIGVHTSRFETV